MSEEELSIPTVDLAELFDPARETRQRAAGAILEGFGTYGLVYLANHGVDFELRDRVMERFAAFCALPDTKKQPLNRGDLWYQRGWTPPNTERAVVAGGQPDFKECYFAAPIATDPECAIEYPQIYAENVWPEGDGAFRDEYMTLGYQIHEAGMSLLQGVATALGLPSRMFDRKLDGAPHVFRLLKYLPLTQEQIASGVLWGEEHTDFNLLTVLPGGHFLDPDGKKCGPPDAASGLFLRTRPTKEHPQGVKVQGKAPPGCIVAQVGQELEILTGGTMLATPHVITAPSTPGYSRLSAAHFLHLHSHEIVFPLDKFKSQETLRSYSPPVLAGTYSIKTLVDIGLAPAAALDRLGYRHYDRLAAIRREEESV
ncbi:MAG: isopenicillin N synthase family oxygenase [Sandaracinaceae bacterium]|nr:isopenicillin N synthase family oxygenase [Sandaracinaceae bacterium]